MPPRERIGLTGAAAGAEYIPVRPFPNPLLALALAGAFARAAEPPPAAAPVTLSADGRVVCEYRCADVRFKPYVRQLYSPAGVGVLRDAPADHPHHHGLMFAVYVDGADFWAEATPPAEVLGRQLHRQIKSDGARLTHCLDWVDPAGAVLLHEARTVKACSDPAKAATLLAWRSRLTVPASRRQVTLTASHYDGLGMRFVESMDIAAAFLNPTGGPGEVVRGDERLVRAPWIAARGSANGHPVTIALFCHPDNPRHPPPLFSMGRPFAYLSATLALHQQPIVLKAGGTLDLRYAVAVFDGQPGVSEIAALHQRWLALKNSP